MAKHRTPVKVYSVAAPTPEDRRPKPRELLPTPLAAVDGKHGSDDCKRNATEALAAAGYVVKSLSFATDGSLVAYVAEERVAPREARSAKPRRQTTGRRK